MEADRPVTGESGPQDTPAFDAFISYSHAADGRLAPALQAGLQSIGKPWYRRRMLRVFRDTTNLGASPELWPSIEGALRQSRSLILLLSPDAASSPWVEREVRWWRAHRPAERPFLVLTAGSIEWDGGAGDFSAGSCVPPGLRGWYESEPFWVSLGWAASEQDVSLRNPRFRDCVADLAAPLRSLPKDELIGEDIRQHRRAVRLARGAVALLALLLVAAVGAAVFAVGQRNQARAERDVALSRQLAAQAGDQRGVDPALSARLSLAAFALADTIEARSELLGQADRRVYVRRVLPDAEPATPDGDEAWSEGPGFAPDGATLVAGAADGRIAATGTEDGRVVVWELDGRRPIATLGRGGDTAVRAVALGPGGRTLAAAAGDLITVWDIPRRQAIWTVRADDVVWALALGPDGRTLASGGEDRAVTLWDVPARARLATLGPPGGPLPPPGDERYLDLALSWVRALAFSPDGRTLAAAGPDRRVNVWNVPARRLTARLRGHALDVWAVAFSPDGRRIVSGGNDRAVILWDVGRRRRVARFGEHTQPVQAVAFAPDGRTVASASDAGVIVNETEDRTVMPRRHAGRAQAVAFAPGGALLASSGLDRGVFLFDHERRRREALLVSDTVVGGLSERFGGLPSAAFSPDGTLLASGTDDGMVILWDAESERELVALPANEPGEFSLVAGLAFSPDGRTLASGTEQGTIALWDVASHDRLRLLPGATELLALAFAPDGTALLSAEGDGVVVRDVAGQAADRTVALDAAMEAAAFSPDGATLATAGLDGAFDLWDLGRGRRLATLRGHSESIGGLAFSPDGRTLASASGDLTVGLWDVARRRELGYFSAPETPTSLAWTSDGQRLAFGQFDGTVVVRDAGLDAWRRGLCEMVGRGLDEEEWAEWVGEADHRTTCP